MSSTRATTLILLVATVSSSAATFSRRILHQPFFPLSSAPPPLPFSTSPPDDQQPFFQSYPSPPPPLLNPSPFASFPANITSLNIPRSSHNPVSHKLVALTVSLSFSAALIACIALFFYFRHSNTRRGGKFDGKAASVISETATPPPPPPPPPPRPPNLNSSEFLYLGTLASSAGIDGVRLGGRGGSRGSSRPRKLDSPELHPLQPLHGRQQRRSGDGDEDCDEFYSPRGSISGSDSRRVFVTILEAEKLAADNNGGNTDDATSFSSSSRSVSPARSASISISPPISASPKNRLSNSYPKSSPEFIELQFHTPFRPNSVLFSPPYSPSSETEKGAETVKVEEEESPLLSSSSSSSRMTLSPPESPRLSPLSGIIGKRSDEEREFHAPIPGRKSSFSSLKLPQFLGGGKRKSSPELTSVSNSPESSHSHPSPISSSGSSTRKSRRLSSVAPTAPPPPPPPPPLPPLVLGRPRSPPPPPVSKPGGTAMPLKSVLVEKETEELMADCPIREESEEATHKPKLKPLHWDKVMANSDREMVWDQLRSSSFQ